MPCMSCVEYSICDELVTFFVVYFVGLCSLFRTLSIHLFGMTQSFQLVVIVGITVVTAISASSTVLSPSNTCGDLRQPTKTSRNK